jgi:hypothetical protein
VPPRHAGHPGPDSAPSSRGQTERVVPLRPAIDGDEFGIRSRREPLFPEERPRLVTRATTLINDLTVNIKARLGLKTLRGHALGSIDGTWVYPRDHPR